MGANTAIEWAHDTHNFWVGCTKVSPACDHCYAEGWAKRAGKPELWNGERRRTTATNWQKPLKWDREAGKAGTPRRVFANSLSDFFDNQVPSRWREDAWHRIEQTPSLTWMLLTKRPQNIAKMLPDPRTGVQPWGDGWPNVWIGTTAEDAEHYRQRWPHLAAVPARVRFLSYEPALGHLGELDLSKTGRPDWIIAGGESGPHARPPHEQWFRYARNRCVEAEVAFFFKQWGGRRPKDNGRLLDGREWSEFPLECREEA